MQNVRHSSWVQSTHLAQVYEAFTLVELLTVIAILSLIISILLPSLNGARRKAAAVACINNQRQIGLALELVSQNQNSYLPPAEAFSVNTSYYGSQVPLLDAIMPYLSNAQQTLFCPRQVIYARKTGVITSIENELSQNRIGYFYWGWTLLNNGSIGTISTIDTENIWTQQGWNDLYDSLVILTDRFRDKTAWAQPEDWQYHGSGSSPELSLEQPGTHAYFAEGSVRTISPR